jgi:organic radical activating enzyme/GNAT superfamily N-acetyltransferase
MKITSSICPVCYKEVPAVIQVRDSVFIVKECPEHGEFIGVVERDSRWYNFCKELSDTKVYDGYLIDITNRCNLNCKYCYHDTNELDKSVDDIVIDAENNSSLAPFILTGGEPTLNKNLPTIIKKLSGIGETWIITNGVKLCDESYLDEVLAAFPKHEDPFTYIGLSFHKEANGKDIELLEIFRKRKLRFGTTFYVIDSIEQIQYAIDLYKEYKDVITSMRIKAASNLWCESKAYNHIYVSDMISYLSSRGGDFTYISDSEHNNKVSFCNCLYNGLHIMLVSWYDALNVDLNDIKCAPYYKAKDGSIKDFVSAALSNVKYNRDNGINIRRAFDCDISQVAELWEEMVVEEDSTANPNKDLWINNTLEFLKYESNHLYIAELKGEMVGFVQGYWTIDPIKNDRYIVGLHFYVKKEYRKSEVAIALHSKYKQVGRDLGVKRVVRQVTKKNAENLKNKGQKEIAYIVEEAI